MNATCSRKQDQHPKNNDRSKILITHKIKVMSDLCKENQKSCLIHNLITIEISKFFVFCGPFSNPVLGQQFDLLAGHVLRVGFFNDCALPCVGSSREPDDSHLYVAFTACEQSNSTCGESLW